MYQCKRCSKTSQFRSGLHCECCDPIEAQMAGKQLMYPTPPGPDEIREIHDMPLEHVASENCWCEPEKNFVDSETGNAVYVHREIQ